MSKAQPSEGTKKTYTLFNPETLAREEKEVVVNFTPKTDLASAMQAFKEDELLAVLNASLQRDAFTEARRQVRGEGIPLKVIMTFIKPYRESPDFKLAVDGGKKFTGDRKAQTDAILNQIKQVPFILTALKAAALEAKDDDTDETESA